MKTRFILFRVFVITLAVFLFYACQKDLDLWPAPSQERLHNEQSVVAQAKEWYRRNMQHIRKTGELDVTLLTPDWDNYTLSENSAGQPWISIPLKNPIHPEVFLTQLSLVMIRKAVRPVLLKNSRIILTSGTPN